MKSHTRFRAVALIAIGLVGMAAYQMILHLAHPAMLEKDFLRGIWVGACIGLELTGLYLLARNRRGPAA